MDLYLFRSYWHHSFQTLQLNKLIIWQKMWSILFKTSLIFDKLLKTLKEKKTINNQERTEEERVMYFQNQGQKLLFQSKILNLRLEQKTNRYYALSIFLLTCYRRKQLLLMKWHFLIASHLWKIDFLSNFVSIIILMADTPKIFKTLLSALITWKRRRPRS